LGNGIAFLPEIVIKDELNKELLKTLDWSGADLSAKLIMIWSKEKHITKPIHAFMLMVKKIIQDYQM